MNTRQACYVAADHIESHPKQYEFTSNQVPECGTTGCAAGWVGYYAGLKDNVHDVTKQLFGVGLLTFLTELDHEFPSWHSRPSIAAKALRWYADKHFPNDESTGA
jgi:hypothetical protein